MRTMPTAPYNLFPRGNDGAGLLALEHRNGETQLKLIVCFLEQMPHLPLQIRRIVADIDSPNCHVTGAQ